MKTLIFIIVLFTTLFLAGCRGGSSESVIQADKVISLPYFIDIGDAVGNQKELNLSSIADSIKYVKFEFTNESLIHPRSKVIAVEDGYVIAGRKTRLLLFNRSGRFIRGIGRIGKGPSEFSDAIHTQYNVNNGLLYVFDFLRDEIKTFDLSGAYHFTIHLDKVASGFHIFQSGDMLIVYSLPEAKYQSVEFVITDDRGIVKNTIQKNNSRSNLSEGLFMILNMQANGPNSVIIPQTYPDTLFQISNEGVITPFVIYKKDNRTIPNSVLQNREIFTESWRHYYVDFVLTVLPKHVFSSLRLDDTRYELFWNYNGDGSDASMVSDYHSGTYGIKNDLDGGPSVRINKSIQNGISLQLIHPVELIEWKEKDLLFNSNTPEHNSQELLSILNSLSEDDNPILMQVYF